MSYLFWKNSRDKNVIFFTSVKYYKKKKKKQSAEGFSHK